MQMRPSISWFNHPGTKPSVTCHWRDRPDPFFPERAVGADDVVAEYGAGLDTVEHRQIADRFKAAARRIEHEQAARRVVQEIARHGMGAIGAMILDDADALVWQEPLAALGRVNLHALDVELDDQPLSRRHQALIEQAVERDHLHAFTGIGAMAIHLADPQRLMLGTAEPDLVAGRGADGALQYLQAAAVELRISGQARRIG